MFMAKAKISPGQVWREDASGTHYLVTRVYAELFDHYAILRKVEGEQTLRVKIRMNDENKPLPGYTQEAAEFNVES